MFLILLSIPLFLLGLIYFCIIKPADYWKKRGITSADTWFAYKNLFELIFKKITYTENVLNMYNKHPNARYVGSITFNKPQFFVRDLNLIKQIAIKDFDNFTNRPRQFDTSSDPLFNKNLVTLEDQKWRDMRATLSPTFTASKMRFIYTLINECAQNFVTYFERNETEAQTSEMGEIFSRFSMDVIATSSYGISVNSLKNKQNEFFTYGNKMMRMSGFKMFFIVMGTFIPFTRKIFKVPFVDKDVSEFFCNVINETIEVRKKNNVIRPDMIHLLLQTQLESANGENDGSHKKALTNEEITAQGLIFFIAGFEAISTVLSLLCYELALNKDIQNRLRAEIDEACRNSKDGQVSYDTLMNLKYLDMVVSESLRKWPAGPGVDRICKSDYLIEPTTENEKSIILPKDTTVFLPIYPIHRDPKYFPNPESFDPERFNDDNKEKIISGSYMPFGVGPRSCIASRFALMEIKVILLHLLSKFEIDTTEKTLIPLVFDKKRYHPAAENGMWLSFNKRDSKLS